MQVYVLKSCDTCRKAAKWLSQDNIAAEIFDIRADGIAEDVIKRAVSNLGWEKVLNRRSTSWRALDEDQKQNMDANKAFTLIVGNPILMKRPLFAINDDFVVGFDSSAQSELGRLMS